MTWKLCRVWLVCVLCFVCAMSEATTVSVVAGKDTHIRSDGATTNYGSLESLYVKRGGNNDAVETYYSSRILMSFGLPADIGSITGATLGYYMNAGAGALSLDHYRALVDWNESQATWNIRMTGTSWSAAGCLGAGTDYDSTPVSTVALTSAQLVGWVTVDVTSQAQDALAAGDDALDILIRARGGTTWDVRRYINSSEYAADASQRPYLLLDYAPDQARLDGALPEPVTLLSFGASLLGLGGYLRRRRPR